MVSRPMRCSRRVLWVKGEGSFARCVTHAYAGVEWRSLARCAALGACGGVEVVRAEAWILKEWFPKGSKGSMSKAEPIMGPGIHLLASHWFGARPGASRTFWNSHAQGKNRKKHKAGNRGNVELGFWQKSFLFRIRHHVEPGAHCFNSLRIDVTTFKLAPRCRPSSTCSCLNSAHRSVLSN